jgi:hypothetical protein
LFHVRLETNRAEASWIARTGYGINRVE